MTLPEPSVILIDDDTYMLELVTQFLKERRWTCRTFTDPQSALSWISDEANADALLATDAILLDAHLPGMSPHDLLNRLAQSESRLPVILASAFGTVEMALQAIRSGAFDYITKPYDFGELDTTLERARRWRSEFRSIELLRRSLADEGSFAGLVGRSDPMQRLFAKIVQVAPTPASVLILGESGTGKERTARAIHAHSRRAHHPFLVLDCRTLAPQLIEAELFGAHSLLSRVGQGTLFLAGVGELTQKLQSQLLRTLESRHFVPQGGTSPQPFEGRVLAASERRLLLGETEGAFRHDLFLALSVITLEVPPLRDRRDDIPVLARRFLKRACVSNHFEIKRLDASAKHALGRQRWSGNVRQLQNVMDRLAITCPNEIVTADDIEALTKPGDRESQGDWFSKLPTLAELEKDYIAHVLKQTHDRKEETARILGINRRTLYRKERDYDLLPPSLSLLGKPKP